MSKVNSAALAQISAMQKIESLDSDTSYPVLTAAPYAVIAAALVALAIVWPFI